MNISPKPMLPILGLGAALLLGCSGGGGGTSSTNTPPQTAAQIVKYGSMTLVRETSSPGKVVQGIAVGSLAKPYFVTGQDADGANSIVYVIPDGTATPKTKRVVLNDSINIPSAYPNNFIKGGNNYLLFCNPPAGFALYSKKSDTDSQITFDRDQTTFDFTAVNSFANSAPAYPKKKRNGWVSCPVFSVTRATLYFTFTWWVTDTIKGDYVKTRICQSNLGKDGKTFLTPTEVAGELDPLSETHYVDGQNHVTTDFPSRLGLWWIGRMYLTADGKKAYFNVLNVSCRSDTSISSLTTTTTTMKAGDPFIAPTPNNQDFGNSGVTDVQDPRVIFNYICSADIDSNGNFINIQQLPATINTGGINFVSDISDDGSILIASHMDLDSNWYANYGTSYGPDGLALDLTFESPWDIAAWKGFGNVWENVSGTWMKIYSTK